VLATTGAGDLDVIHGRYSKGLAEGRPRGKEDAVHYTGDSSCMLDAVSSILHVLSGMLESNGAARDA
jgi:hypothetical protein